jgi:hypothetical protein
MVYKRLWDAFELSSCLEDIQKYDAKATFDLCGRLSYITEFILSSLNIEVELTSASIFYFG